MRVATSAAVVWVSVPTAHRRFVVWAGSGVFDALHRKIRDRLGAAGDLDWSAATLDAAGMRAKKRGSLTGSSPVDRRKKGSKIHTISDANGIPLVTGVSAGNTHDSGCCNRWSNRSREFGRSVARVVADPSNYVPIRVTTTTSIAAGCVLAG